MIDLSNYPNLAEVLDVQLSVFPEHETYLTKRFADSSPDELRVADDLALKTKQIAGTNLRRVCESYKWLSGVVLEEELFFRREGRYRLCSFQEAYDEIYNNREYMSRYMDGLLISQIWWGNHCQVHAYYCDEFIAKNPENFSHLEVGPGHGLFLFHAAESTRCASATAWDVSEASLANTRAALDAMKVKKKINLVEVNIFDATIDQKFDSITFSEVLEHLEQPLDALKVLHGLLKPGGRIFINAPVNSPAPDHLYLFNTPEEIVDMINQAGFTVEQSLFAPSMGVTLERARKRKMAISTAVIATKS